MRNRPRGVDAERRKSAQSCQTTPAMSFRHRTITVTPFQQNCSLVWDDATQQAAVIDPGGDIEVLLAAVQELGLTLEQIWLTHAHIDIS